MKTVYEFFRMNITKVRSVREWSAKELSEKAGLRHPKRISDIEDGRGTPSLEEVISICNALSYSVDDMLFKTAKVTVTF